MPLADAKNFVPIADNLVTAGQPTEDQLRDAAASGFELVVNLGLLDPRYALADEAGLVNALGMRYVHIPVDFKTPRADDFENFAAVMDANRETRTLVHCAANYRVSAFISLYGQKRWGWTDAQAEAHMRKVWEPDAVWRELITALRARAA
jgi:protein tyrosine phosphatase (PTP) superfamily phosphohydrolase (DUF442 family)